MIERFKEQHRIKIGFLPTRRNVFDHEEAGRVKNSVYNEIKKYGIEIITIDSLNEEGLLYSIMDSKQAAQIFITEGVDAIFAPHCNFGTEDAVAKTCKMVGKPVLIWGPQEDPANENGFRKRDSQCGLFATSKVLMRYGVPFSYIINSALDSCIFYRGFIDFLQVASVVKSFLGARIGQVDTRPEKFLSVMVNESEILEKFGIETVPVAISDIAIWTDQIFREKGAEFKQTLEEFERQFINQCNGKDSLEKAVALKIAISRWAGEKALNAVAIQCWDAMQSVIGIFPCFVNGVLTDEGLPVACETDITGAISALILKAASGGTKPAFLADLTALHPQNKNVELLWHCGNFPSSYAGTKKIIGQQCEGPFDAAGKWEMQKGDITIAKMDGIGGKYSLLMGQAKGAEGPMNAGTYLWAEFENWPKWERHVIYGPYIHHVAVTYGSYAPILYEACRYIPDLKADPVDPSLEEIEEYFLYQKETEKYFNNNDCSFAPACIDTYKL